MGKDKYTGLRKKTVEEMKKVIQENNIDMIRLEYTDILGINRDKLMPVRLLDDILEDGIAFCARSLAMAFDNDIIDSEYFSETSDDMIVIGDPSTFVLLPHCDHTALILGDLYYKGKLMSQSPRGALKKIIMEYQELGYDPYAASELEFYVYNKGENGQLEPYINQACACYTANRRVDPKRFLYQLAKAFDQLDFNVLYMNHEFYPGQFEYNWKYSKMLRAADEGALFKALAKDVAETNDLMLTFMAKPKDAEGGSGCHFHVSIQDLETGKNLCDDPSKEDGISDLQKYMIGGLIKHAKSMTAFLAPTVNCYKRYQPDSFAPVFVGWGYDNRTTYIRVPNERGAGARFEIRAGSAAANPYLALTAIMAASLDGIKNKIMPPDVIETDLYHDIEKQESTEVLPNYLDQALRELESDAWLKEVMGPELIDVFIKLKRHEVESYRKFVTDWEMNTYSFHV